MSNCPGVTLLGIAQIKKRSIEIKYLHIQKNILVTINISHSKSTTINHGQHLYPFLVIVLIATPLLFRHTRKNEVDSFAGHLSYPIYICHFLVIWTVDQFAFISGGAFRGSIVVLGTVLLSAGLYGCIDRPVDIWWQRRLRKIEGHTAQSDIALGAVTAAKAHRSAALVPIIGLKNRWDA